MNRNDALERYEVTEAQEIVELGKLMRLPTPEQPPPGFRAKLMERLAQQNARRGRFYRLRTGLAGQIRDMTMRSVWVPVAAMTGVVLVCTWILRDDVTRISGQVEGRLAALEREQSKSETLEQKLSQAEEKVQQLQTELTQAKEQVADTRTETAEKRVALEERLSVAETGPQASPASARFPRPDWTQDTFTEALVYHLTGELDLAVEKYARVAKNEANPDAEKAWYFLSQIYALKYKQSNLRRYMEQARNALENTLVLAERLAEKNRDENILEERKEAISLAVEEFAENQTRLAQFSQLELLNDLTPIAKDPETKKMLDDWGIQF